MGGCYPSLGSGTEARETDLGRDDEGAFGCGSGRPCRQQVGMPRDHWCLDLNFGKRPWLQPLPDSYQQEVVTEALVFGRIAHGRIYMGKVKELGTALGNGHWSKRALRSQRAGQSARSGPRGIRRSPDCTLSFCYVLALEPQPRAQPF